MLINMHA